MNGNQRIAVTRSEDFGDLIIDAKPDRERSAFKVMAAIHRQGLKSWLHGAPFFSKPAPPVEKVT